MRHPISKWLCVDPLETMRVEVRLRDPPLHSRSSYRNLFPLAVNRLAWTPETIQAHKHTLCAPRGDLDRPCDTIDTSPTLDARTTIGALDRVYIARAPLSRGS